MGQTCGKQDDTTDTQQQQPPPPNMKLFFAACGGDRRRQEETGVTKQIRPPPTRPTPVIGGAPTAPTTYVPTAREAHSSDNNNNNNNNNEKEEEEDHFDLSSAPPLALPEHQDSYRVLLSLLRRHRTSVGSALLPLLMVPLAKEKEKAREKSSHEQKKENMADSDYLLHLMCACPNVNTSVVGLLAFAHPRSTTYRSLRTKRTPLQVALSSRNVSMEVITLLFEYETRKTNFCQETLEGDLLPLAVLLEPVTLANGTCSLRSNSLRHALFMRFVLAWKDSLKFVDKCWSDYYHAWMFMDEIGSGSRHSGGGGSGGGGGGSSGGPHHFHQCFGDLKLGGEYEHQMETRKGERRQQNREIDVDSYNDEVNEELVEGAHNLLSLLG